MGTLLKVSAISSNTMIKKNAVSLNWLQFLIIILIVLGIVFRFANLEQKIYWNDEVFTSLRVSGYTEADVQQIYDGRVINREDLQKFQRTNADKGIVDTLKSLTVEGAQHPPLYFLLVRFWVQLFGNSVAVTRSLSALFSVLSLPALYWLCRELFKSPTVGWIAVALMAVSPFHILYAQAARQYSLWGLIILLSSGTLLRALRQKNNLNWVFYTISLTLGLYTFPFFLFGIVGHGIYLLLLEKWRFNKLKNYLFSVLTAVIAFAPWVIFALLSLTHVRTTTSWLNYSFRNGLPELFLSWMIHITRLFADFEFRYNFSYKTPFPYLILILALVAMAIYSLYYLCQHTPPKTWLFILTLIGAAALPLILPDLILGGKRSGITRYLLPAYLGIQIAIAYFLATQINKKLWQAITVALFTLGILSYANSATAAVWWNNGFSKIGQNPEVAVIVNQAENPLVVSDEVWGNVISLSYSLAPTVHLQLTNGEIPKIPDGFSDYFLYKPSQKLREAFEKSDRYRLAQSQSTWLWRIRNQ